MLCYAACVADGEGVGCWDGFEEGFVEDVGFMGEEGMDRDGDVDVWAWVCLAVVVVVVVLGSGSVSPGRGCSAGVFVFGRDRLRLRLRCGVAPVACACSKSSTVSLFSVALPLSFPPRISILHTFPPSPSLSRFAVQKISSLAGSRTRISAVRGLAHFSSTMRSSVTFCAGSIGRLVMYSRASGIVIA